MNFRQELEYCEKIIAPYKEQISDEILYEIYSLVVKYWLYDKGADYPAEELEDIENRQGYELFEMIGFILVDEGIPFFDNYRKMMNIT